MGEGWRTTPQLRYPLTKPGPQDRTVLTLSPLEFRGRIAALIPTPRKHRHRYFGVLAPNSPWREALTSRAGLPLETEAVVPEPHPAPLLRLIAVERAAGSFELQLKQDSVRPLARKFSRYAR